MNNATLLVPLTKKKKSFKKVGSHKVLECILSS